MLLVGSASPGVRAATAAPPCCEAAPRSSAGGPPRPEPRSTCRCQAVSLGALQECPFDRRQLPVGNRGMAAGPRLRNAAVPPDFQRARHSVAVCLATPSWRATAAVGTPWANSSTARSRTACRLARSLAPSPCWRGGVGLVERSVGVQVLQPQAPQRLGPRSGPDGGLGVVRCSRAVRATRLRLLASHTLTSTRRKLIGRLQLPTGDGQPDRRVALHTHRNVAYRSDVTNHRKWTLWRLLSILQESLPGWPVQLPSRSDTDVMAELLAREADLSLEEAIARTMPRLEGAFSLVIMDERTLYGVRDRHGIRPLCIGKLPGGWVIASETAALDIVGATLVREVEPGEVVAIDEQGLRAGG